MLLTATSSHDGVNLIHENNSWCLSICHREESLHQLLTLAHPLRSECASTAIEEGGFALGCDSFCEHGLTVARRSVKQNTFGWREQALEDIRAHCR